MAVTAYYDAPRFAFTGTGHGTHSSGLRIVNRVMETAAAATNRKLGDVANPSHALVSASIVALPEAIAGPITGSAAILSYVGLKVFQHLHCAVASDSARKAQHHAPKFEPSHKRSEAWLPPPALRAQSRKSLNAFIMAGSCAAAQKQ